MSKQHLDALCWQWAETTDPSDIDGAHVNTAYHLNLKPCKPTACRRNCKGNPYCVSAIGERDWLLKIDDSYWHDITEPVLERRKEGSFVGLKNLGATCYVNTFLQVWFHNLEFRSAIYRCNQIDEKDGSSGSSRSICAQLQLVFALLQFSQRQYVDPTPLITSLGLDTAQQQDAQEFSKLFMSLLEETGSPLVVTWLFQGHYNYVTKCGTCEARSLRQSTFYELDLNIKGHRHLSECIEEFLKEECLDGDNSYMCSVCECKRKATRSIQLMSLPPVLHLQLLRFVFDRRSAHKRKLNTLIQFPERLNMAKYLQSDVTEPPTTDHQPPPTTTDVWYELVAVLVHNGASAHSGHYVAQIRDATSNAWYRFNDEAIDCMNPGRKAVHLGAADNGDIPADITGKVATKAPRPAKGEHISRNAYMLVYRRETADGSPSVPASSMSFSQLPRHVQQKVEEDNTTFDAWTKVLISMREERVQKGRARQSEVNHLHSILPAIPGAAYEWLSLSWLQKYMSCETVDEVPAVDHSSLLCDHDRLDPDKITSTRCISKEAADFIYAHYKGGPRLRSDVVCWPCVRERCHRIHTKARIDRDSKLIASMLKSNTAPPVRDDAFWVGKLSLRSWKRMAMAQLQHETELVGTDKHQQGETQAMVQSSDTKATKGADVAHKATERSNGVEKATVAVSDMIQKRDDVASEAMNKDSVHTDSRNPHSACSAGENGEQVEEDATFNEELLCEHGELCIEESSRRLVPVELWTRLRDYFPSVPQFDGNTQPCSKCYAILLASRARTEQERVARANQKAMLADLYHDRHRPVWSSDRAAELWVIPASFLTAWRNFIRGGSGDGRVTSVGTEAFLCQHGCLPYQPETIGLNTDNGSMVFVWPTEWQLIQNFTTPETGICISRIQEDSGHVTFISSPDVCEECCRQRLNDEYEYRLKYENAVIFVRKVDNTDTKVTNVDDTATASDHSGDDMYVTQAVLAGKRKLATTTTPCDAPDVKSCRLVVPPRRSSRQRRVKGENQIHVSSTQTLRQLKLQIMHLLAVAPFDQNLSLLRGISLDDDKASLGSLQILPGDTILLRVQQPLDDALYVEDCVQDTEQGFKGTGLQGR